MGLRYLGNIIKPGYNPLASNITTGVNVVQYQGVFTAQQQLQAQANQQWSTDPLFDYSTLLLQADGIANGSQNNTFLDSSTNNFTITRNGNTTQGTFSPFSLQPGAWANYFGGSSDYLLLPSNSANFLHTGAADWTFECWFWATQTSTTATLFSTAAESAQVGIFIGLNNAVSAGINVAIYRAAGGGVTYGFRTNASVFTANTWNHVAITYSQSGNTYAIYLNGISQTLTTSGTASYSGSNATYQPAIGRFQDSSPGGYYSGYISNMRAVNGSRVYTANFTPSPVPLTAITSTAFLTCQSNRFIDNSTNAYAVTVNGTPSVQAFSPFAPQFQYTASGTGGSGYFDGNSDYLNFTGTNFNVGTGAFTLEGWIYMTTNQYSSVIATWNAAATGVGFLLGVDNTGKVQFSIGNGNTGNVETVLSASAIPLNSWVYLAATKAAGSGGTMTLYVNGTSVGTTTTTRSVDRTAAVIGRYYQDTNNYYLTGYLADVRVSNTVRTISVPTAPLTSDGNTLFLASYTNAGILDGTMKNNLETVADAKVSTSVVKYGSGSLAFDGTGDQLYIPSSPIFGVGTGQFTIEFWLRFNAVPTYYTSMFCGVGYGFMQMRTRSGGANLEWGDAGGTERAFATQSWTANQWYHIAITRDSSNVVRIFVDGVNKSDATYTVTTSYSATPFIIAGGQFNNLNGYMDDFRFTTGIARYTQNFIPPSVALPRQ